MGTPNASNIPGGRQEAASWIDSAGNLWLFGGMGTDSVNDYGYLNDLWKFNTTTKQWAWISGGSTILTPGCTSKCVLPTDGSYGTQGVPAAGNEPPGMDEAATWIDQNDDLWIFGGAGPSPTMGGYYRFNNLWEFNPAIGQWTWISGGGTSVDSGVYGTMGTPAPGNTPPAGTLGAAWTDSNRNMWLFGGDGFNDLWKFNSTSKQWTWMAGTPFPAVNPIGNPVVPVDPPASYGTLGISSASNHPGGRSGGSASWEDSSGNFWLFGAGGIDAAGNNSELNDFWEFNPANLQWAWMSGSDIGNQALDYGIYGVEGTPSAANIPGARYGSAYWKDNNGNLWLFGGYTILNSTEFGYMNDLWRYQP